MIMTEINLPPFYVGQKVVCINTERDPFGFGRKEISKGTNLTVRKCYDNCIFFEEVINQPQHGFSESDNCEPAYHVRFYAPVQENFQSISLEKILEKETSLISAS